MTKGKRKRPEEKNDFFGKSSGKRRQEPRASALLRGVTMGRAAVPGAPRSVRAGRSTRHAERHIQRGHTRTWAPSWSDATAAAVMQVLEGCSERATGSKKLKAGKVAGMLASAEGSRLLVSCAGADLVPDDRSHVAEIINHYHKELATITAAGNTQQVIRKAKHFLKPLYVRRHARTAVVPLRVPPSPDGPISLQEWLGPGIQGEKLRQVEKSDRMLKGLEKWPLDWMTEPGVVVYERAHGRIVRERPLRDGRPDTEFTKGLVKTIELPTAVANPADHYVVLEPGHSPRYMRTSEVARAFMIPTCRG